MTACRYCQYPGAYDSGFKVECPNPDCRHFSLTQCKEFIQDEIRRRCLRIIGGEPGIPAFPAPFIISNPGPMLLAVTWQQPEVKLEYITWKFEF